MSEDEANPRATIAFPEEELVSTKDAGAGEDFETATDTMRHKDTSTEVKAVGYKSSTITTASPQENKTTTAPSESAAESKAREDQNYIQPDDNPVDPEIPAKVELPSQKLDETEDETNIIQSNIDPIDPETRANEISSTQKLDDAEDETNNIQSDEPEAMAKEESSSQKLDDNEDGTPPPFLELSDLSRLDRTIWVVTTAALPWRTGTSVNPLARALYLTRGRPKHSITLMIPWLPDKAQQAKLFGGAVSFENPEEQESWIRTYCAERVHCEEEAKNLRIRFYDATYNGSFGSIFPIVDICALIPDEEADVCILEEPEHLNWMRVGPDKTKTTALAGVDSTYPSDEAKEEKEEDTGAIVPNLCAELPSALDTSKITGGEATDGQQESLKELSEEDADAIVPNFCAELPAALEATIATSADDIKAETEEPRQLTKEEIAELGWAVKFKYVVGIIHTNYDAYVSKYGMGAAFLAGSALQALSSLVTRAYCHRIIRLSDTLPILDKPKEITCNIHGVRHEFFETPRALPSEEAGKRRDLSSIYFIGKLVWAKGFDQMLETQELYKKQTGDYFKIDIYGSGPEERPIQRAFFGRKGLLERSIDKAKVRESTPDRTAAGFFRQIGSLREQLVRSRPTTPIQQSASPKSEVDEPIEVVWNEQASGTPRNDESYKQELEEPEAPNPFVILRDLSGEFVGTGVTATMAGAKIGHDLVETGVHVAFSEDDEESQVSSNDNCSQTDDESKEVTTPRSRLRFDPPMSRFELRRHAVPARFLGMMDHALVRDLKDHKIFFNPSKSEVLCTTSAEALAMGKFVILPKHPSNTFFLQFSNCLAYESLDDCVRKLQWALDNTPKPLTKEEIFQLTWEGATERLYESSRMTKEAYDDWISSGRAKADEDAARLHIETVRKGRGVQRFLKGSF